ncbi:nuclear transport factor 2 family protein [Rhodococcus sp. T2V]|uniref:nuclear transport factor 2 family protein n=1 Tax=Rhodococcus sp. T2V TaxID=3034164 RepID=UPI0023E1110D|nr:nuclear transport factor 2 family protein [Rhodococcus sp. T2V]MDF3311898.1 nuclear transport factor 2 family protein [Rhodococcus sp. T2V]
MSSATDVLALDHKRREAMTAPNVDALSDLLAENVVWIHATARVDTKAGLLEAIGSGSTKYLSIDVQDETVKEIGGVVLIGGIAHIKAEIKNEVRDLQNRFTIIWAPQPDGAWRVVNWQSTTVRKP